MNMIPKEPPIIVDYNGHRFQLLPWHGRNSTNWIISNYFFHHDNSDGELISYQQALRTLMDVIRIWNSCGGYADMNISDFLSHFVDRITLTSK